MKRKAISLFKNDIADKQTYKKNAAKWILAVQYLGDKWLLAKPLNFVPKENV